jgi:ribosomal protein L11 methyltransferase
LTGRRATAAMPWLELSIAADSEAVEAVSEILSRVAPGGVAVEPAFDLVDEGLGARLDASRPAVVRAYLPVPQDRGDAAVHAVDTAIGHLRAFNLRPIGALQVRVVDEADWAEAWKVHFPVLRIGRRIVIRPTWRRHRAGPGDVVLALDPGMAFGTGLHPTTRLCLLGLEALADDGRLRAGSRVLDVGCGSGILSLAAVRLGAGSVLGLDIDPIAVEATTANARRNRVARRVRARLGGLPSDERPFDLVVANLIASVLVRLAEELAGEVAPRGAWLVSGIFVDREAEVRRALAGAGLEVAGRWAEDDWVALAGSRRLSP